MVQCHRNALYDTRGTDTDVRALVPLIDDRNVLYGPSAEHDSVPNLPFFYLIFRAWSHWRGQSDFQIGYRPIHTEHM